MSKEKSSKSKEELLACFDSLNIEHETFEHPALFTVEQTKELNIQIPGAHTKNLFLKDDHKQFWLISALQDTKINLRKLAKTLPAKNLRFAQAELLPEYLGVEAGSVTWFALINDQAQRVNAVLDQALFDYDKVGFHPLINTATTVIAAQDLVRFVEGLAHDYQVIDLS